MVLSFSDDKNVTDEYEYVYIPREMSKKRLKVVLKWRSNALCVEPLQVFILQMRTWINTAGTATRVSIVGEAACRLRISKTYFRTGQKKNGN